MRECDDLNEVVIVGLVVSVSMSVVVVVSVSLSVSFSVSITCVLCLQLGAKTREVQELEAKLEAAHASVKRESERYAPRL